jgi:mevalonate kinase
MTRLDAEKRIKMRKRILVRLTRAHAILEEHPQHIEEYTLVVDDLIDRLEDAWKKGDDEALCRVYHAANEVLDAVQRLETD